MEYAALQDLVSGREEGRADLAAGARARDRGADGRVGDGQPAARGRARGQRSARGPAGAGLQALTEAVTSGADAADVLLAGPGAFAGVLGPLAQLLTVADGAQEAIAAALGAAAGSVVVAGLDAAVDILAALRRQEAGRAGLVIASGAGPASRLPEDLGAPRG